LRDFDSRHLAESVASLLNLLILYLLIIDYGDGCADLVDRLRDARRCDCDVGEFGRRSLRGSAGSLRIKALGDFPLC
jgi:hypothetical protein